MSVPCLGDAYVWRHLAPAMPLSGGAPSWRRLRLAMPPSWRLLILATPHLGDASSSRLLMLPWVFVFYIFTFWSLYFEWGEKN